MTNTIDAQIEFSPNIEGDEEVWPPYINGLYIYGLDITIDLTPEQEALIIKAIEEQRADTQVERYIDGY